jgi:predicted dehydrogenase
MLRGAVIGFGRMGLTHFSILNNHPQVEFVSICDPSTFLLKNISRYLGLEVFKDHEKMVDTMNLDFVIVAAPIASHAEAVKYAIKNDLHVFVEKPFSLNPRQSREIVNMLRPKNLVNQVGYVVRFNDVFFQVKKLLDSKLIGDLLRFKMEINSPTLLKDAKSSWRSKKNEGGGCLYDFASHGIDLINYLIGPPDDIIGTMFQSIHSTNVEDSISSTFVYINNIYGILLANWSDPSYRKPAYRMEILGRKGKVIANLHAYKIFLQEESKNNGFTKGWNRRYITDYVDPVRFYVRGFEFTRQLDYFIDCIINKKPCQVCSFEDGLKTDMIIERIVESSNGRRL